MRPTISSSLAVAVATKTTARPRGRCLDRGGRLARPGATGDEEDHEPLQRISNRCPSWRRCPARRRACGFHHRDGVGEVDEPRRRATAGRNDGDPFGAVSEGRLDLGRVNPSPVEGIGDLVKDNETMLSCLDDFLPLTPGLLASASSLVRSAESQVKPSPSDWKSMPSGSAIKCSPVTQSSLLRNWMTATGQSRARARMATPNAADDLPLPSPVLTRRRLLADRRPSGRGSSSGGRRSVWRWTHDLRS